MFYDISSKHKFLDGQAIACSFMGALHARVVM